jgi:hypothetical protein
VDKKYKAGALVAILGVAIIVVYLLKDRSPASSGCVLTSAGVADMAHAFAEGDDDTRVIAIVGGALASPVCTSLVRHLYDEPTTSQQFTVMGPDGNTEQSITKSQLVANSSPPSSGSLQKAVNCWIAYPHSQVLDQWCVKGIIGLP